MNYKRTLVLRKSLVPNAGFLLLSSIIALILLLGPRACVAQQGVELRVLFIGNSLTYYNDLPEMISHLARSAKQKMLVYRMIAEPNFGLEDHWNKGEAVKAIRGKKWDYVVLQQGPSASVEGREMLMSYSQKFAAEIVQTGANPALYAVWPSRSRHQDFDRSAESYRLAAGSVGGLYIPVGEVWRDLLGREPNIRLYAEDGLHPTSEGSYLSALTIYHALYKAKLVGLPHKLTLKNGMKVDISEANAGIIQAAVTKKSK